MSSLAADFRSQRLADSFTAAHGMAYNEQSYQALSAAEKNKIIWDLVESTQGENGMGTKGMGMVTSGFVESHDFSMEHFGDELKEGRRKFIHQTGLIAQARLDTTGFDHPFTGLFRGAEHCLIRCSLARRSTPGTSEKVTATPGIGLKVFRDGCHSGNMVAMYGVDGQHSWNFFRYPLITAVGEATSFKTKLLGKAFALSGTFPGRVGMSDFASHGSSRDDTYGDTTNFPFLVEYHSPSELRQRFGDEISDEMLQDTKNDMVGHNHMKSELTTLQPGDVMFVVKGWPDPWMKERGEKPIEIGKLILKTTFVESSYADDHLFFKHQRYEEDFVLRPAWGCPAWFALNQNGATEENKTKAEHIANVLLEVGEKEGIKKTHTYHLKTYANTLIGKEMVQWMLSKGFTTSVEESILMGKLMVASGILQHTHRQHTFKNEYLFYTFVAGGHSAVCPVKWRRIEGSICPMHAKHDEFHPLKNSAFEEGDEEKEEKEDESTHLTVAKLHYKNQ